VEANDFRLGLVNGFGYDCEVLAVGPSVGDRYFNHIFRRVLGESYRFREIVLKLLLGGLTVGPAQRVEIDQNAAIAKL
jgi:hypothetical protein